MINKLWILDPRTMAMASKVFQKSKLEMPQKVMVKLCPVASGCMYWCPPPATRDTVRVVTNWGYWGCSTSPQASATGQVCTFLLNFPCNNNNYQFISHQLNTLPLTFTTEREIIGLSSYRSKSCLGPGSIKLYHTNFKHFSANMNNFDPFILNFVVALCVWKAEFWSHKPRHFLMVMKVLWSF